MKKLRLDLDDLQVEQFVAGSAGASLAGTVEAHQDLYTLGTACDHMCGETVVENTCYKICGTVDCPPDTTDGGGEDLDRRIILY